MSDQIPTQGSAVVRSLGWGVYLACSWTWCIGMFLPVLLVRDFGVWGWVVFAVPNVVGAAAMGWVIRSREQSEAMVAAHRVAFAWFSAITIAFQIFFAIWIDQLFQGLAIAALTFWALVFLLSGMRGQRALAAGAMVFLISIVCFAIYGFQPARWVLPAPQPSRVMALIGLAPVCALGFFLCPYLDLTFQKARRSTSRGEARVAFGVGFGVLFALMILFTLAYGSEYNFQRFVTRFSHAQPRDLSVVNVVAIHMFVQLGFTIAVHLRELIKVVPERTPGRWRPQWVLLAGVGLGLLSRSGRLEPVVVGITNGELIYRIFMGFYGLVFPAYVWLCMIGSGERPPDRRRVMVFTIAVLLAMPFFYVGFIQGRMPWLLPGVGIVLFARFAARSQPAVETGG